MADWKLTDLEIVQGSREHGMSHILWAYRQAGGIKVFFPSKFITNAAIKSFKELLNTSFNVEARQQSISAIVLHWAGLTNDDYFQRQ